MVTRKTKIEHIEWFDAEEMHEHSKKWFSELSFIKDEQQFLKNLIQTFAIKPLNKIQFGRLEGFKKAIEENEYRLELLFKKVQKHMNQLRIMVDDVNQLDMEKAYKKTHKKLYLMVNVYLLDYRTVKERGFVKLSSILKSEKEKSAFGNPDYKITNVNK
jgi:hypothetical protein